MYDGTMIDAPHESVKKKSKNTIFIENQQRK